MRMRKKPNLIPRMERCAQLLVDDPAARRGRWRELKPDARAVWLEIGCGKGRFSAQMAAQNPDVLYVALERVPDAMVIAMERCMEAGLDNIFFLDADAAQLRNYFAPGEVDRIFLNFCDPWPGLKHARRRLTHPQFLVLYRGVLREGGELHFKSDNHDLFEWSLFQFPKAGYALSEVTRDLHANGIQGVMTDYEEKFHQLGTPINRCVATKEPWTRSRSSAPSWARIPAGTPEAEQNRNNQRRPDPSVRAAYCMLGHLFFALFLVKEALQTALGDRLAHGLAEGVQGLLLLGGEGGGHLDPR